MHRDICSDYSCHSVTPGPVFLSWHRRMSSSRKTPKTPHLSTSSWSWGQTDKAEKQLFTLLWHQTPTVHRVVRMCLKRKALFYPLLKLRCFCLCKEHGDTVWHMIVMVLYILFWSLRKDGKISSQEPLTHLSFFTLLFTCLWVLSAILCTIFIFKQHYHATVVLNTVQIVT